LFQGFGGRYTSRISTEEREIAMLRILIASGEKALEAFQASDNPIDASFVAELERIVQRSREELAVLTGDFLKPY
jgi:hypothetical protein